MRLAEQLHIIKNSKKNLSISVEAIKDVKSDVLIKKNIQFNDAILALSEIPALNPYIDQILKHSVFLVGPQAVVSAEAWTDFHRILSTLSNMMDGLSVLLKTVISNEDVGLLAIKLPKIDSLTQLEDIIRNINQIFDIPARTLFGSGVRFSGFDTGSAWLLLDPDTAQTVATAVVATGVTAGVIKASVNAAKRITDFLFDFLGQYQSYRADRARLNYFEKQMEEMAGTEEIKKLLKEKQAAVVEAQLNARVEELFKLDSLECSKEELNEARGQLKNAMRELDKLVQRGTEIHPSLSAPVDKVKKMQGSITGIAPNIPLLPASSASSTDQGSANKDQANKE